MHTSFLSELKLEMGNIEADYGIAEPSTQFAVWVGEKIFGLETTRLVDEMLLLANDQGGAIIGYFDDSSDKAQIIVCWYVDSEGDEVISERQVNRLVDLWRQANDNELQLTPAGEDFLEALKERGPSVDIEQHVVTSAPVWEDGGTKADVQLMGLQLLIDAYLRTQHPLKIREPELFDFLISSKLAFEGPQIDLSKDNGGGIPTLVCALPLALIHSWVAEYRNGLFSENLRLRLSEYDKQALELENEIKRTVLDAPEQVFVRNNGITITCSAIKTDWNSAVSGANSINSLRVRISDPQIVNGCQTSWAIHNVVAILYEQRGTSTPDLPGYVLAKIVQTKDERLAAEIATSSNRQNAIQARDRKVKDRRQVEISTALAKLSSEVGVFWDYMRGGWSNILANDEQDKYLTRFPGRKPRLLPNDFGGQIILAMAGAVHDAKNKAGRIFESESLYEICFGFDLEADTRFKGLQTPRLQSGLESSGVTTYVDDLLFGFAVYQHAIAAFKWQYSDRVKQLKEQLGRAKSDRDREDLQSALRLKAQREFVKYWAFDVVRFVYIIVDEWVELGEKRQTIRGELVGNLLDRRYLDPLFLTKAKRENWFNMEIAPSKPNTLDRMSPSDELRTLGTWFKSLEEIGSQVILDLQTKEPNVQARTLVLGRPATHEAILERLGTQMKAANFPDLFPKA